MGFDAFNVCNPDADWNLARVRDAMQASEPQDVAYCAGAMAAAADFRTGAAHALGDVAQPALRQFSELLLELPAPRYKAPSIVNDPVSRIRETRFAVEGTPGIQNRFFHAATDEALNHGLRLGFGEDQNNKADAVAFIKTTVDGKSHGEKGAPGFGERHTLHELGDYPEVVTPDYELISVGGAFMSFPSQDERAARVDFNNAAHHVEQKGMWPATLGAMAGYHGARHASAGWLNGQYESFDAMGMVAQGAYAFGDKATLQSVGAALDKVVNHIDRAHRDTDVSARSGDAPDLGWPKTMSYFLHHRADAPLHASPKQRAALAPDLALVKSLPVQPDLAQREPGQASPWAPFYRAAEALARLGKDADLFDQAIKALGGERLSLVLAVAIGYDASTGRLDLLEGSRRPQPLMQAIARAAHDASDGDAAGAVGVALLWVAKKTVRANEMEMAAGNPSTAYLPLTSIFNVLVSRSKGVSHNEGK